MLVRRWMSLRRLLGLVAGVFYGLHVWGAERFERLRQALRDHPWPWPKKGTCVCAWMALHIARVLHPKPIFDFTGG